MERRKEIDRDVLKIDWFCFPFSFSLYSFFAPECLGMIMKALSVVICSTDPRLQVDTIVKVSVADKQTPLEMEEI